MFGRGGFRKVIGCRLTRAVTSGKFFLVPGRGLIAGKEELTVGVGS
jgi:hypothetical protein